MSFWKNLAKYALMAAPIVAAPFTGGASLLAIGALSGAAGGALGGGGVKGALLGGALGAIPGVGGVGGKAAGAAMPTLTAGLKQAGIQAAKGAATSAAVGAGTSALTGGGVKGALTGGLSAAAGGIGSGGGSGSMATTGTSNAILQALAKNGPAIAGAVGAAASGMSKGKASDRAAADKYALDREQLGLTGASVNEKALADRARLDLDQHIQAQKSGESAFQNALRASVIQNFKPAARPNGVANISFIGGGPSAGARAAASAMEHEAMQRLLTGEKFAPMDPYKPYQLASSATPQKAGTLENVMGILGTGLSGYSGVQKDLRNEEILRRQTAPMGETPQPVGLTMTPPVKRTLFDYDPIPVNS